MDRLVERFDAGVAAILGDDVRAGLNALIPHEMQGLAGTLRGAFTDLSESLVTVRLTVAPWDTDERWQVMVQGRTLGPSRFWDWLVDEPLCRIPFVTEAFSARCSLCGDSPCLHGAALTYHWLLRVRDMSQFLLLFLNRRGKNHHVNANMQPIARVPVVLGTNLDRTRRELVAILDSALKAAGDERDNIFGGEGTAPFGER